MFEYNPDRKKLVIALYSAGILTWTPNDPGTDRGVFYTKHKVRTISNSANILKNHCIARVF
jgi:hypothetical protein